MSYSRDAELFIVREWRAALKDADVNEGDYHLIVCPGASASGYGQAVTLPKGLALTGAEDSDHIIASEEKISEANHRHNIDRHRIACYEDLDPDHPEELAYLAAVLRHEIEHGKQRDALGAIVGHLADLSDDISRELDDLGGGAYRDLRNSAPVEADANAASSSFVRHRYPDGADVLAKGDNGYLVEAMTSPGDPTKLTERTIEWLWQFRQILENHLDHPQGQSFADVLDRYTVEAGNHWRYLARMTTASS